MADWKALIYRAKGLNNGTRVLLLYLAERMQASDRTVSVPRNEIAEALGVHPSRITERIREAREAGFLDTVIAGRPGVTSVYAAMYPTGKGADGRTSEGRSRGAKNRTSKSGFRGADGWSPNSEHGEAVADERTSPRADVQTPHQGEGATTAEPAGRPTSSPLAPSLSRAPQAVTIRGKSDSTHPGNEVDRATRRALLDEIQRCAADDCLVSLALVELLNTVALGLGDWALDYWDFPKRAATDRYEAGKQLQMLQNTYRQPVYA